MKKTRTTVIATATMKIKGMKKKNFVHVKSIYGAKDLKRRSVLSATMIISVCWDDDMTMMIMQWKSGNEISKSTSKSKMYKYIKQRGNRTTYSTHTKKEINVDLPKLYVRIRKNVRSIAKILS